MARKRIEIYALISSYEFETAASPYASELQDDHLNLTCVALIPQGINNSSRPRRKLFLKAFYDPDMTFEKGESVNPTQLLSFTLSTDFKVQALSRLYEKQGEDLTVSQHQLAHLDRSVRQLYQQELLRRRAAGREKHAAISYEFTPDITIWCAKSYPKENHGYPRLEAYICEPFDPKKAERGYMERGAKIQETVKRTTSFTGDNLSAWLEFKYPFSDRQDRNYYRDEREKGLLKEGESVRIIPKPAKPKVSIRETIIEKTAEQFRQKNLGLKTIWYIYPCLEDLYSGGDYKLLNNMMLSELGWFYVADATEEQYLNSLFEIYPEEPAERLKRRCQILYTLLEFARKQGHCSGNALQDLVTDEQRSRRMFSKIRSAMTRKNLTLDELFTVFRATVSRIREGKSEYLGVLIRLLTGLESNIVCALRWGDLSLVEDYGFYRLAVTRQVSNDGRTLHGFDSLEDYRLLACCELLSRFLLEERAKTEAELAPFYAGSRADFPIVRTSDVKTGYLEFQKMLSPILLEKRSKEILAEANMDDHVIEIPDSLNGTKETNLSHYSGDFFRENFKYWGQELCKFNPDELANMVGNKPVTTFGRYYCDYLNDASLLVSFVKLQRLDAILSHEEEIRCFRKSGTDCCTFEYECSLGSRLPMHLHLWLTIPEGSGDIRIEVKNRFGLSTSLSGFSEE